MSSKLYYDGACPLCRSEVERLARRPGAPVCFDIHQLEENQLPAPRQQLLRNLHLYAGDGRLVEGLDANLHAWRLAGARFWPWLLSRPLLHPLAAALYRRWAVWRYQHRYGSKG